MRSVAISNDNPTLSSQRNRSTAWGDSPERGTRLAHSSLVTALVPERRVLIAEDDAALRTTLKVLARGQGFSISEAEDGDMALAVLGQLPIDVLILDLAMPKLDGLEVLRRIDAPPPLVIIYSAFEYYSPEHVQSAIGSKVFRSLQKPVPPGQLISVLADAARRLERGD